MRRPGVAVSFATVLLLAALFAGDSVWTAFAALLGAGALGALALAGRMRQPGAGTAPLGLLLGIAAWAGLSVLWSVAPDRSWAELDRTLVFAAFLAVGLLVGASGSRACRWAAAALTAALGAAVLWALAGKAIPALFPDGDRAARLRDPIGYWNALALAADVLLVLGLWLASNRARTRALRAAGAVLAYAAVVAVLLAVSRTGVAGAAAAVALWLWVGRERLAALALALAAALPAAAVAGWAFTRPALVEDGAARADRVADGALFGLLLIGGGAVAVLASELVHRREPALRRRVPAALAASALVATVAAGALAVALGGSAPSAGQGPGRLFDASANNRLAWWGEAVDIFAADPIAGAGAGTFEVARKRFRDDAISTVEPHSVPLQFLAGTGLVGLALLLAFLAAAALAVARALPLLEGAERAAAAALATVPALWLLHALVDYDWNFVAVTGPALFALGVLAAAGRPPRRLAGPFAAVGVAAFALAAAAAVATPWLAQRSVRAVGTELAHGELAAAADAAERARSLDPLSLAPLYARARVEEARGDGEAALATYREAVGVQPENPETWYQLGLYEFHRGDRCSAYVHLNEAYTLDPSGRQWVAGGPLVQALEWVNEPGNC
jgi:tetratricopeptide (TPR) repeat protein